MFTQNLADGRISQLLEPGIDAVERDQHLLLDLEMALAFAVEELDEIGDGDGRRLVGGAFEGDRLEQRLVVVARELGDRLVPDHRRVCKHNPSPGTAIVGEVSHRSALALLFAIGAAVGLIGDASHVQAGITEYLWSGVPTIWKSALWFPLVVGGAMAGGAWIASRLGRGAEHDRRDVLIASALILGLYCLTTLVADAPQIAANGLLWGIALAIWLWWDPSPRALAFALITMVVGPAAEIVMVGLGASQYLAPYDGLFGVAPWLMPLYFAVGAVLSGALAALSRPPAAAPDG